MKSININMHLLGLVIAVLTVSTAARNAIAQNAACNADMAENTCEVPFDPEHPEYGTYEVDFIHGHYPNDYAFVAIIDSADDRCDDAVAVGDAWDLPGVDMAVDVTCDDTETLNLGDGVPTINWDDLTGTNLCGDCPSGVTSCACLATYCPGSYPATHAVIVDADIFIEIAGLEEGPPPVTYSASWDVEHTNRALISHELGAAFNLADINSGTAATAVRTMSGGSSGHWSAGASDDRVHALSRELYCLRQIYGADTATEDDIDLTLSNTYADTGGASYETDWSLFIRPSDLDSSLCPGEEFDFQYTAYNRAMTNILTLGASDPFEVALYASTDQTFNAGSDTLLGQTDIGYFPSEALTVTDTEHLHAGAALSTAYYIFAVADPDDDYSETNEGNNVLLLNGRLTTKSSCP